MTKEEIIEMAQRCGLFGIRPYPDGTYSKALVGFAKLIAEKECEECAKLCDYVYNNIVTDEHIKNMAFKIRARGQE